MSKHHTDRSGPILPKQEGYRFELLPSLVLVSDERVPLCTVTELLGGDAQPFQNRCSALPEFIIGQRRHLRHLESPSKVFDQLKCCSSSRIGLYQPLEPSVFVPTDKSVRLVAPGDFVIQIPTQRQYRRRQPRSPPNTKVTTSFEFVT